jgi:hypothetical protein
MSKRFGLRHYAGLTGVVALVATTMVLLLASGASGSVSGAISTTDNGNWLDTYDTYVNQECSNGHGVNCNIYLDKRDVWLTGLPVEASLGAGTYFFAVVVPGGQPDPNDGGAKNVSDTTLAPWAVGSHNADGSAIPSGDAYTNRTFTVDDFGNISYVGSHDFDAVNNEIQMFPYDDTTNPGGVYILAACSLGVNGTTYPVDPHSCKYDAFKVNTGEPTTTPPAFDLTAFKSATPNFTRTYSWDSAKSVSPTTTIRTSSTTATANYTVTATWSGPVDSGWQVDGTIDVLNPNAASVDASISDVITTDGITDDGNETCTVYEPETTTALSGVWTLLANSDTAFPYSCTYNSSGPADTSETNVATISWDAQALDNGASLDAGTTDATALVDWSIPTTIVHDTATVTDSFHGGAATKIADVNVNGTSSNVALGVTPSYASPTFTFTYSRTLTVDPNTCTTDPNTVAITGITDATPSDNTASVTVCPTVNGLTIGYWNNKNGQGRISGSGATTGVCNLDGYLRGTLSTSPFYSSLGPFHDLSATASCSAVATYVSGVIKAATCTSTTKTCNTMLRAQLLATALNVYFGVTNGNEQIDLVHGCAMIDSSGGGATCTATENWSSAFGGTPHLSVFDMLHYAATQDTSSLLNGLTNWYGQAKAKQVLAKDAFDAINNGVALAF